MATLSEDGKSLVMEDGSTHDIHKAFISLECGKVDLYNAQKRIEFCENIISEARKNGYLTEAELDDLEQKKHAEEKKIREEKEAKDAEEAKAKAILEKQKVEAEFAEKQKSEVEVEKTDIIEKKVKKVKDQVNE